MKKIINFTCLAQHSDHCLLPLLCECLTHEISFLIHVQEHTEISTSQYKTFCKVRKADSPCPLLIFALLRFCWSDCLLWWTLHLCVLSYYTVLWISLCDCLLCSIDWPWTQDSIASSFQVQGLYTWTTMPGWPILILTIYFTLKL